jgi:hypothetical protein
VGVAVTASRGEKPKRARAMAWVRLSAASFLKVRSTCVFTVADQITSSAAISAFRCASRHQAQDLQLSVAERLSQSMSRFVCLQKNRDISRPGHR